MMDGRTDKDRATERDAGEEGNKKTMSRGGTKTRGEGRKTEGSKQETSDVVCPIAITPARDFLAPKAGCLAKIF